jgi:hypothetical protein
VAVAPGIIDQEISASGQWDGSAPPGTPVDALGIRTFPPAATGGRFDVPWADADSAFETYVIDKIMIDFGASATNTVKIVDGGSREFVLDSPGAGLYLFTGPLELAWDEHIEVTSLTNASAMHGRVHARPGRSRPASF